MVKVDTFSDFSHSQDLLTNGTIIFHCLSSINPKVHPFIYELYILISLLFNLLTTVLISLIGFGLRRYSWSYGVPQSFLVVIEDSVFISFNYLFLTFLFLPFFNLFENILKMPFNLLFFLLNFPFTRFPRSPPDLRIRTIQINIPLNPLPCHNMRIEAGRVLI